MSMDKISLKTQLEGNWQMKNIDKFGIIKYYYE